MNAKEIKRALAKYEIEFKNSPVNVNVNSPLYYNGRTLRECYKHYNTAKLRAYNYCTNLCATLNGENSGICFYNSYVFSYHFTFTFDNKQFYAFINPRHNYAYPIGEKI